ncbi:MAG TPA: 4-hydroxyphenylacetate 3-hydroxylase N-terminal domain-containing protein [Methylomirabilota bacterium]|nr:4-hydroxyphenylacetate 3-hydroxylase N-terminal domain-containing protein [Methylomirabilota bacterium]
MRSGDAYVASLRDGRAVFLDGERVDDVTKHPAFVEPIRRIAETYDRAKAAAEDPALTFADPATGVRHSNMWLIPRSADDLGARRRVHRFWAEPSFGLMGRTPDHVACVLTAFASWRHLFDQGGTRFGDHVVRFHQRARDEDLYVTYAIVPPQVDRSRPAHRHPEPFLHPGVVRETSAGVVIRGAHAIATSATMADWLFVSYITPLVPGDEDYAISLVMPMNAEGLRLYPRRPFASLATSVYDYPLSSRFDEVDTTVVFNDVLVPWEQVFIHRNVELVNAQFHDSPSHTTANFQALVRFGVKLEFMAGLAARLAEIQSAEGDASVQATLGGDIAALCAAFDALVKAAERDPLITRGVARPHPQYIYAGMGLQRRLIVDMMRTLRELAGGAFQTVPSSEAAFASAETRADAERYYQSTAAPARERIKLVKLIWDFVGTEFGGRQLQYEMFYSASQPVVNRRMFRSYDWTAAKAMVARCLGEY